MVAIAKLMDATLVLPTLDHKSFWTDPSDFKDIFDIKQFKTTLQDDIDIVESLPSHLAEPSYYQGEILSLLKQHKAVNFLHIDSQLANNGISDSIQKLRCRTMFEALKCTKKINELATKLINRLKQNNDHYLALHLRFEKDILAFTGCTHGLSQQEADEIESLRYSVKHWKVKKIKSSLKRQQGNCPLTPRESAIFLQSMGFPLSTKIYIVAGEIYGERGLDEFKEKYMNVYTHSSLATEDELKPFKDLQNQLAALDYALALASDVFVYTYDGNMAKAISGHRMFKGFQKTIYPHKRKFVKMLDELDKGRLNWYEFSLQVKKVHADRTSRLRRRNMGLWTLLEGCLLIANALAILNEDRFLAPRGWSFQEYSGVKRNSLKGQIIGLIYATQYLRVLLILFNSLCIVVKLVSG
ncbi:hypothetical protein L1987_35220 [Smallanthus sonchifolius]|uniref:Uncharacterized protein n=1 Tax=Smallanthus sonchifolius TaxID=185202 RepID=A0ACB9HXE1_9ASTR|nr:hypothetical protein L1987_35220 [Smallanthus sonchifolius]